MVSKNQIKFISGLQQKKQRLIHKMFVAEGVKVVQELLDADFELHQLYTTEDDFKSVNDSKKLIVSADDLKKISALTTASSCLAVFKIPEQRELYQSGLIVALDAIRDPGNLGTIIRLCDWFGIQQLICSNETVDVYNPKVVQATMGSISRVNVSYINLEDFISTTSLPVFGTFMNGENIYSTTLPQEGIIVMGNEANGISKEVENNIQHRLAIPRFGSLQKTESLNVATATAIILSEFRRVSL